MVLPHYKTHKCNHANFIKPLLKALDEKVREKLRVQIEKNQNLEREIEELRSRTSNSEEYTPKEGDPANHVVKNLKDEIERLQRSRRSHESSAAARYGASFTDS